MRFSFAVPALAAGVLLAAVTLTAPANADSDRPSSESEVLQHLWNNDALGKAMEFICSEPKRRFGKDAANFLLRRGVFDPLWIPSHGELNKLLDKLGRQAMREQRQTVKRRHN